MQSWGTVRYPRITRIEYFTSFVQDNSLWGQITSLGLTSSCFACWDVTSLSCYSGSGTTLTDLSGNGNNLTLDSAGMFTGTAGDSQAYIAFDGTNKAALTSNPTAIENFHKSGFRFTLFSDVYFTNNPGSGQSFCQTVSTATGQTGFTIWGDGGGGGPFGKVRMMNAGTISGAEGSGQHTGPTFAATAAWKVFAESTYDGGGSVSYDYLNGTASANYSATSSSPASGSAAVAFNIGGAFLNQAQFVGRWGAMALWSTNISSTNCDSLYNFATYGLKARHSL